jgi:ferrochelatase
MSRGVLLLAHGTPDALDEMEAYLTRVRGGRAPAAELVAEMRHNYAAIGGRSPLTQITLAQAAALHQELGGATPVFVGLRHSRPFIDEALATAVAQGCSDLVAIPLAPQFSALSVGKYREVVERATPNGLHVRFVESWHDQRALLDAFAEQARAALARASYDVLLFTAHSVPERLVREGDPYPAHVSVTAQGVAGRLHAGAPRIAYQSAGRTPEAWLGPTLDEALEALRAEGRKSVLVVPIGFVCDHMEILYDIDIAAQATARRLDLRLARSASLNTSPLFIRALAEIVRAHG